MKSSDKTSTREGTMLQECWKLCGKHNLKRSEKWYEHAPGVVDNEFSGML